MFSQVSVCPQGGGVHPQGERTPQADPAGQTLPHEMATAVDGTHPPGMHSCLFAAATHTVCAVVNRVKAFQIITQGSSSSLSFLFPSLVTNVHPSFRSIPKLVLSV